MESARRFKVRGYVKIKLREWCPYPAHTDYCTWEELQQAAGRVCIDIIDTGPACFFLIWRGIKTFNEAPKFKTLEAAVAAALIMGVPEG